MDHGAARVGFGRCLGIRMRDTIESEAIKGWSWPGGPNVDWDKDEAAQAWVKAQDDAIRAAKAYAEDASAYRADVFTGPDFFCALFAETDAPK